MGKLTFFHQEQTNVTLVTLEVLLFILPFKFLWFVFDEPSVPLN